MCLGIPMQIVSLEQDYALVDSMGVQRDVSTVLVSHEDLKLGDWLMIHVGYAIGKIDQEDALETLSLLEQINENLEMEINQ